MAYKHIKDISDKWNKSFCNPFDLSHDNPKCPQPVIPLAIPEQPYIKTIQNILRKPFVNVEKVRTPIDNLIITVRNLTDNSTREYTVFKYLAYLPHGTFDEKHDYMVTCVAVNEAGISPVSNEFYIDLGGYIPDCYGEDVSYLDCDIGFCCNDIYVCL